jgi:hypothetical protein
MCKNSDKNKPLRTAVVFDKCGIDFVPIPVLDAEHKKGLRKVMVDNLIELEKIGIDEILNEVAE